MTLSSVLYFDYSFLAPKPKFYLESQIFFLSVYIWKHHSQPSSHGAYKGTLGLMKYQKYLRYVIKKRGHKKLNVLR